MAASLPGSGDRAEAGAEAGGAVQDRPRLQAS